MNLAVYAPKEGVTVPGLDPKQKGAALVAFPRQRTLELYVCPRATQSGHRDFCFADRVSEAASAPLRKGRIQNVTKVQVKAEDYVDVALWDDSQGVVRILPGRERELHRWLGSPAYRNDLEASDSQDSKRQDARRRMRRAYTSGRPDEAQRIASKHGLRGW
jgi:hypothetical protein